MFTQSCFIRKNTPELRKKLEELGYKYSTFDDLRLDGIITFSNINKYSIWANYHFDMKRVLKSYIDCGTNEELFLALAALRDDTDKDQWFTNGIDWGIWREEGSFRGKPITGFEFHYLPSSIDYDSYHKATVKEIIEHFTIEK